MKEGIYEILNENYILKSEGETEKDCMAHDLLVMFENALKYAKRDVARRIFGEIETIDLATSLETLLLDKEEYQSLKSEYLNTQL